MSRMLEALRQIEARRPPQPDRDEGRRVDDVAVEEALQRVETVAVEAEGRQVDDAAVEEALQRVETVAVEAEDRQVDDAAVEEALQRVEMAAVEAEDRRVDDAAVEEALQHVEAAAVEAEGRQADDATTEEAFQRVEAAAVETAAERIDDFAEPIVAMATDLESATVETPVDTIAESARDMGVASFEPPPDARTRALDGLAERIMAEASVSDSAVLMFGSPLSDDDTTHSLAELAPVLAQRIDGNLLLLDANFEGPGLADFLGATAERGLLDVVLGQCAWREAIRPTVIDGVDVLPGRGTAGESQAPKRLSLGRMFEEFRSRYRLILVDAGSLRHPQAAPLSGDCDGACLLLRPGETPARALRDAVGVIRQCGGRLFGTVVVE